MFRAAVLGLVQGLTEFVPVSSSGHLILVPFLLRWPIPDLSFDVAVHLGTALGVILYFARDLAGILSGTIRWAARRASAEDAANARLLGLLAIGSIPAGLAGLFLEGLFEQIFTSTGRVDEIGAPIVALFLLGTAGLLWLAEAVHARRNGAGRELGDVGVVDALIIGLFQALAIAPGISRSGSTIGAAVFRGVRRDAAARFSFLLSIPAILGAAVVALPDIPSGADLGPMLIGAAVAAVSGFAAVSLLLRYLRTRTMRPFAVYCVVFAAISLAYWSQIR